mmetsp:Transcript_92952/g.300448  ORF Transcript_92952/g.300448 Transcript_92952/m.300448 type:complete len:138 (+) Transcript_92952:125-538(+)
MRQLSSPPTLHSEHGTVDSASKDAGASAAASWLCLVVIAGLRSFLFCPNLAAGHACFGISGAAASRFVAMRLRASTAVETSRNDQFDGKTSGHIKGLENARQPSPLPVFLTVFAVVGAQLVIGFVGCVVLGAWNEEA